MNTTLCGVARPTKVASKASDKRTISTSQLKAIGFTARQFTTPFLTKFVRLFYTTFDQEMVLKKIERFIFILYVKKEFNDFAPAKVLEYGTYEYFSFVHGSDLK